MRSVSYLGLAGGVILLATSGLYLGLIIQQGDSVVAALPWALAMAAPGLLAAWATLLPRGPRKRNLLMAAGAVILPFGLVALASVGLLLIAGGVAILAAAAAEPRPDPARSDRSGNSDALDDAGDGLA